MSATATEIPWVEVVVTVETHSGGKAAVWVVTDARGNRSKVPRDQWERCTVSGQRAWVLKKSQHR